MSAKVRPWVRSSVSAGASGTAVSSAGISGCGGSGRFPYPAHSSGDWPRQRSVDRDISFSSVRSPRASCMSILGRWKELRMAARAAGTERLSTVTISVQTVQAARRAAPLRRRNFFIPGASLCKSG